MAADAVEPSVDADLHHDIARDIGQQVELMILEAKHQSEGKVVKEIQKIKTKMEAMTEKIRTITDRVARLEPGLHPPGLPKVELDKSIKKLEEVWEGEVGTLKHELWQTIQAHNHNADLLKHHKDAIDQVQQRVEQCTPNPELEQIHQQLLNVDRMVSRETAKEQQMDQLMQRLNVVQQQLNAAMGGWAASAVPNPFALASATSVATAAAAAAAAAAPAAKKATKKVPKAKSSAKASSQAASLRAEAPEFVPTTSAWES